ncbi:MAG TPA: serine/threonine-protein kinase, partial [Minicystis sp.]|nr:serine/threonine-protein kinase [Minicystis sp.]
VVQTNEVGHELGRYFIAMEYLEGQPLNRVLHRLNRSEGLPLAMHLRVISEVCAGLHHAHELTDYDGTPLGVVHRDVTPHNVFVTYDGQVKVVDFGIAKALNSSAETRTGVLKGKVAYMAPEQARGERVDRRADIFSVGVLLWEAAAGKRLWKGVPDITILQRLLSGDIPRASSVRPVAPRLEAIIARALADDRNARYATAAELQAEIDACIDELGARVTPRDVGRMVAQHFENDRAKIKVLIEEQLRRPDAGRLPLLQEPTATASATSLDRATFSGSGSGPTSSGVPSVMSVAPPGNASSSFTAPSALSSSTSQLHASNARRGLVAAVALAGGAALAVVFWVMTQGRRPQAGAAPPPVATAAPAAPTSTEVELRVRATPPGATIFVDDRPVSGNPYVGKVPKNAAHTIRVEADGYVSTRRTVNAESDLDVELALQKDEKTADRDEKDKDREKPAARRGGGAQAPAAAKEDELMRAPPKPKRTLDPSNPYAK